MAEVAAPVPQAPVIEESVKEAGQLSQNKLMRLRFARNRLAMVGLIGLIVMYILVFLGPFVAPNEYSYQNTDYIYGSPTEFTLRGQKGNFGLFVYPTTTELDKESFKFVMKVDKTKTLPLKFFVKGDQYTLFGFIHSNVHLFGVDGKQRIYI